MEIAGERAILDFPPSGVSLQLTLSGPILNYRLIASILIVGKRRLQRPQSESRYQEGFIMDMKNAYEWGKICASPWNELAARMSERASILGLPQDVKIEGILWSGVDGPEIKFCFVNDPSDIDSVRRIFNDNENASIPTCFIVVKQPDPSQTRGDVIFDIFRMSSESYLWHFNRVYTPPK